MLFIGRLPSGASINAPAAFLLSCFVASSVPAAHASPECKTLAEARAAFPNTHIRYRLVGGVKCWGDYGPRARRSASFARAPVPAPVGTPAAPRSPSVLWPALAGVAPPEAAALYQHAPMTRTPILLDIDADPARVVDASGNDAADFCCWPALEAEFRERWYAMPAAWFVRVQ